MRRSIAALAVCATLVAAQDSTSSIDIDAISVPIPTTVFNLPVVYVTDDSAPIVTATTLASNAVASSDPSATDVFDSPADVTSALSVASVLATATSSAAVDKRAVSSCMPQPTGISHQVQPDTAAGWVADSFFASAASAAINPLPTNYVSSFVNLNASNSADNYMGYTLMTSYNAATCGAKCSAINGCNSFNIYFERDPSVNPDDASCSNPASTVQVKCVFWGGAVTTDNANNYGQWRNQFQVLIAGSNGYINSAYAAALASGRVPSNAIPRTSQEASAQNTYDIYSGYDSNVGAYSNAHASLSYQDCETACDADVNCNAFTYVGGTGGQGSGTCWLKQKLGKPTSSGRNVVTGSKTGKLNTLTVLSVVYDGSDITNLVQWKSGNNIVVDATDLTRSFGSPNNGSPYQGDDVLSLLYTNGTTTRVFTTQNYGGVFTLAPFGVASAPNCVDAFVQPNTASTGIVSVVWGPIQVSIQALYDNFNGLLVSKNSWQVENSFMMGDTAPYRLKHGVVWYTTGSGTIQSKLITEHGLYTF
ncbi:hypothetical protein KCU71_g8994, partial [Aureobasidium melanogenum]